MLPLNSFFFGRGGCKYKKLFFIFDNSVVGGGGNLNPGFLCWKSQEVPIELQGFWRNIINLLLLKELLQLALLHRLLTVSKLGL